MEMRGQDIREAVERQRSFVREDAGAIGPQPGDDQLVALAGGKMDQAVDAAVDAEHAARAKVMSDELRRIARVGGLLGGEEAVLCDGDFEELVPAGAGGGTLRHAQMLSAT